MTRERDDTATQFERRREPRHAINIDVNYRHDETYLYSHTGNISEMGIYLLTDKPLAVDTKIELRFAVPGEPEPLRVQGEVRWVVHPGGGTEPGMGVKFLDPSEEFRQRIRELIRTMAYLE
ncbi:MAG: TIGR02266 family protein [Deltaproteobacteria bacterium]|nr:TIGR02266 family protein [Deltaproteobacteria bacterium]